MISDARGGHVSPGIYTEEKDVVFSVKSLGITSLGLVGETLYGPAFENIEIENWGQFVDYFGGTSPEKFKGTGLPKYELPYVAKSYLEESKRLNVVRVLGLSGYKAGPAWIITTEANGGEPVVILRSKMSYTLNSTSICEPTEEDPQPLVKNVKITEYKGANYNSLCESESPSETLGTIVKNKFSLEVKVGEETLYYNVSLNPSDSDYIYKVLSSRPDNGTTPIYVEAVYESVIPENGLEISSDAFCLKIDNDGINTKTRYFDYEDSSPVYVKDENGNDTSDIDHYEWSYREVKGDSSYETDFSNKIQGTGLTVVTAATEAPTANEKKVKALVSLSVGEIYSDYREMYRAAQTPWIVSDVAASTEKKSMRKLFKFITISDGDAANYQIKVSIQNIRPDEGTFDVVVRDFNDDDSAPMILEKFSRCSLIEGDASYIAFKIGTVDGGYASKSKYIAVEMAEGEDFSNSIPAGFLGYPMPDYLTGNRVSPSYNVEFDASIKPKRQYFGLNNKTIDTDILKYKGVYFYDNNGGDANPEKITKGFHMDSILSISDSSTIYVDGKEGYEFDTVSTGSTTAGATRIPRLFKDGGYINETIYKDIALRKFTVYFYGGFDGWDVNREQRTNGDDFKASRYNVFNVTTNSVSTVFKPVSNDNDLNFPLDLPSTAITSDYYAYLAGYRKFANPQDVDINVFATPGIDWKNNKLLTEEALDIIEDADDGRGGDALYIMNAPRDLYADEIVDEFENSEINSSYAATYYPWVMYYDASNKRYLDLPVTKDVVRNMAKTDNNSFPWFAPAGMERGEVKCIKAMHKTTLAEEDKLYEGRINPVKSFAQDGVKIWGNKTAYDRESPLNRVNVRRLMIRVKKLITDAAKHLIFEQYDDTLEKQFRGLVEPILADVKSKRGIFDFRVITEVTPETRDQHILPARILIKPTPALEYISISFVVYPESISFDES